MAASSNLKSVAKKRLNLTELYVQCIVLIFIMRITQLRQADLNLLVVFSVLAEERNVSRAAKRLLLSQPSVSRALQRMRDTFHDDLLVRTAKGYEPTPQGERVLQELEIMLPKLDRLISGSTFDPATEHCSFGLRQPTMRPRSSRRFCAARFCQPPNRSALPSRVGEAMSSRI